MLLISLFYRLAEARYRRPVVSARLFNDSLISEVRFKLLSSLLLATEEAPERPLALFWLLLFFICGCLRLLFFLLTFSFRAFNHFSVSFFHQCEYSIARLVLSFLGCFSLFLDEEVWLLEQVEKRVSGADEVRVVSVDEGCLNLDQVQDHLVGRVQAVVEDLFHHVVHPRLQLIIALKLR